MASCSTHDLLNSEILKVKRFASWNGFPRWSVNKLIKTFTAKPSEPRRTNETEDIPAIWIKLPFIGKKGCCLVRNCTRTISRLTNKPVKFVTHWQTVNASTFVSPKILSQNLQELCWVSVLVSWLLFILYWENGQLSLHEHKGAC